MLVIAKEDLVVPILRWARQFGGLFVTRSLFNQPVVVVASLSGAKKVLQNTKLFQKSKTTTAIMRRLLGEGLVAAFGQVHTRQRALLNPAFRPAIIAALQPVFYECAMEVREKWNNEIDALDNFDDREVVVKGHQEMAKVTLDIIGKAGFGHSFKNQQSSFYNAFNLLSNALSMNLATIAENMFPILEKFPSSRKNLIQKSRAVIDDIANGIILERKEDLAVCLESGKEIANDLMTVLIRANLNEEVANRITDHELAAQVTTFIAAGHETTSNLVSWVLHILSQEKRAQDKLFEELREKMPDPTTPVTPELLNSMTFLESVVKETIRLFTPVPFVVRSAMADAIIDGYLIPKNTIILVSFYAIHRVHGQWGNDADEWRPERWESRHGSSEDLVDGSTYVSPPTSGSFMPFSVGPR
ncbi:hypothetical protein HDU76_007925 [Blyttiomyces sp. JEL0837]|nr:hypothetical protein HDU76_007925 [Blyttiomyces sp. JEL0837]